MIIHESLCKHATDSTKFGDACNSVSNGTQQLFLFFNSIEVKDHLYKLKHIEHFLIVHLKEHFPCVLKKVENLFVTTVTFNFSKSKLAQTWGLHKPDFQAWDLCYPKERYLDPYMFTQFMAKHQITSYKKCQYIFNNVILQWKSMEVISLITVFHLLKKALSYVLYIFKVIFKRVCML